MIYYLSCYRNWTFNRYMSSMKDLEQSSGINRQSEINRFEQQYHQNRLQMEINWNSDISALREEQKRDFRSFIMNASSSLLLSSPNGSIEENNTDNGQSVAFSSQHNSIFRLKNTENKLKTKSISRSRSSSTILSKLSE